MIWNTQTLGVISKVLRYFGMDTHPPSCPPAKPAKADVFGHSTGRFTQITSSLGHTQLVLSAAFWHFRNLPTSTDSEAIHQNHVPVFVKVIPMGHAQREARFPDGGGKDFSATSSRSGNQAMWYLVLDYT